MDRIEIIRIETLPYRYSFRRSMKNARQEWGERIGIQIRLWDRSGMWGLGEASPLLGYSAESFTEVQAELESLQTDRLLCMEMQNSPETSLRNFMKLLPIHTSSARFAIETALLDLCGKQQNLPISKLFQEHPQEVALATLLEGETEEEVFSAAHQAMDRGIDTWKYKIGRPGCWEQEIAKIRMLRKEFSPSVSLRLDANQAWPHEDAKAHLTQLYPYRPEFVEEPTQASYLLRHAGVAIALDESLQQQIILADLPRILSNQECQVLVLKPMMLGGFCACIELARMAYAHGVGVVLTHSYEGPIGLAATLELALALSNRLLPCGLDWPLPRSVDNYPKLLQKSTNTIVPGSYSGLGLDTAELQAWISKLVR